MHEIDVDRRHGLYRHGGKWRFMRDAQYRGKAFFIMPDEAAAIHTLYKELVSLPGVPHLHAAQRVHQRQRSRPSQASDSALEHLSRILKRFDCTVAATA